MPFELHEAGKEELPELIRNMWETYENPPQDLFRLWCPLNAVGATDRETAIQESTERFAQWHKMDPTSHWQKVVDTSTDKIAGGALWKLHPDNPHQNPQHHPAYWHPEGGQRDFASQALWQHEAPRERLAQRPHIYLNIIWMHPDYQRRGGAGLILKWGIQKAAEMGVEMWLDAWKFGRPVYERFGFVTVDHHHCTPRTDNPDEAWKACEREWTDLEEWVMWRPWDGPYVEGKSVKPWESTTASSS